jgi:hypothetical protein
MRRARGQSLIVVLALVGTLAAALLLTFNVGQLTNDKQRLINAADAAAYSGAQLQARSLNFQAYLNRAMIANEVAIAQAVSLRSWSRYMLITLDNINTVGQFIPYVGQVTRALDRIWEGVDRGVQPAMQSLEISLSIVVQAFSAAASSLNAATAGATGALVNDAIASNDSRFALTRGGAVLLARNANDWRALTRSYEGRNRERQRDLILRSRDGFTTTRVWTREAAELISVRKRGGTELIGFDTWRGMDTLAVHRRDLGPFGGWRERTSVGWGSAENGARTRTRGFHGGSWRDNRRTAQRAENEVRRGRGYRGVPTMRDVADTRRGSQPALELGVEVGLVRERLRDASRELPNAAVALTSGERLTPQTVLPSNQVLAQARARVEFVTLEGRRDARRELPSVFSPYWRARLVPVPREQRATAALANGYADPYLGSR